MLSPRSTALGCLVLFPAWTRFAEHCLRVSAFLEDPEAVPLYEANNVDTVDDSGRRKSAILWRPPLCNTVAVSLLNVAMVHGAALAVLTLTRCAGRQDR